MTLSKDELERLRKIAEEKVKNSVDFSREAKEVSSKKEEESDKGSESESSAEGISNPSMLGETFELTLARRLMQLLVRLGNTPRKEKLLELLKNDPSLRNLLENKEHILQLQRVIQELRGLSPALKNLMENVGYTDKLRNLYDIPNKSFGFQQTNELRHKSLTPLPLKPRLVPKGFEKE